MRAIASSIHQLKNGSSRVNFPQLRGPTEEQRSLRARMNVAAALGRINYSGDGLNDFRARAHTAVGIAIGSGADVVEATAPVVLLNGGLWKVPVAIDISRECIALIRQNWTIISVTNTVALGLALVEGGGVGAVTVVNNGSAILARGNAHRPLMRRPGAVESYSTAKMTRSKTSSVTDWRRNWET